MTWPRFNLITEVEKRWVLTELIRIGSPCVDDRSLNPGIAKRKKKVWNIWHHS